MKFCPKRTFTYPGINGTITTVHYVTENDIEQFHGREFFNEWKNFSTSLIKNNFDNIEGYFYEDYRFLAYRTDLFLSST